MRFLFCSLASHGFVYPALGVARALRRRGHEAAFVTTPTFEDTIRAAGFRRIPRGPQDGPSFQIAHWHRALSVAIQVKHIEYALERFPADVLVGQPLTLGPLLVRERRGLPTGILGLATYLWPTSSEAEHPRSERAARQAWRYRDMLRLYNEARRLFRLPPRNPPPEENPLLGDLFLLQSVPELARDPEDLPDRVRLVGACLWEPPAAPDPELMRWLGRARREERAVLYVQQGRSFQAPRFWSNLVDALAEAPLRVAAAVGRMDGEVGQVPDNFLVRDHLAQGQVLGAASAVVCGGNTTAVLGALTHRLPSLLLPAGGEQEDLAEDCERAGVALRLAPDADATTLGRQVQQLLADRLPRAEAARLGRAFARLDGCETAAAHLARLGAIGRCGAKRRAQRNMSSSAGRTSAVARPSAGSKG